MPGLLWDKLISAVRSSLYENSQSYLLLDVMCDVSPLRPQYFFIACALARVIISSYLVNYKSIVIFSAIIKKKSKKYMFSIDIYTFILRALSSYTSQFVYSPSIYLVVVVPRTVHTKVPEAIHLQHKRIRKLTQCFQLLVCHQYINLLLYCRDGKI